MCREGGAERVECGGVGVEGSWRCAVCVGMKGDGVVREFLSLGSTNGGGCGEREGPMRSNSGRQVREGDEYSLYLGMLSHLSRNGLSMLAGGGSNGGFSLKPLAVGMPSLCNLASNGASERASERASAVCGGGFTGFTGNGAAQVVPKTARPSLSPMGLRFGNREEMKVKEEAGASSSHRGSIGDKGEQQPVIQKLTTDECWRLILKLGTQWPAWHGAATPSQATQGLTEKNDSTLEVSYHGHPSHNEERVQGKEKSLTLRRGEDFLKLLATRALEALARTPPDHYGKAAGGMLAPKQTTQEVMDPEAAGDAPETPTKVTEPSPLAKAPSSSRETLGPKTTSTRRRTAALTIFYDGIVNICDNVPADKARLIMMFAGKAGVSLNAQALLRKVKCVAPSLQPSPQVIPSTAVSQEDLQHSKPSPQVMTSPAGTSSDPSDFPSSATHVEGSTSDQEPAECSNPAQMAVSEPCLMPLKTTITTEGNSRHHVIVKPLPNARKNTLARFLDSRKRNRGTASCSEGGSPKKQALGDGCCPSDSDQDLKASGKSPMPSLCSQFSFDFKEGICANCQRASDRATADAEMKDSLVE